MKLTYLGASYTPSTQAIDTVETDTELSFLGHRFKMRAAQSTPQTTANRQLTYRGVSYNV